MSLIHYSNNHDTKLAPLSTTQLAKQVIDVVAHTFLLMSALGSNTVTGISRAYHDGRLCLRALLFAIQNLPNIGQAHHSRCAHHHSSSSKCQPPGLDQILAISQRHPYFAACLLAGVLHHQSLSALIAMQDALDPCNCNRRIPAIAWIHESMEHKASHLLRANADRVFSELCSSIFRELSYSLRELSFRGRLQKIKYLYLSQAVKRREKWFLALAHHLFRDIQATLNACAVWYERTRDVHVLAFLRGALLAQNIDHPDACANSACVPPYVYPLIGDVLSRVHASLVSVVSEKGLVVAEVEALGELTEQLHCIHFRNCIFDCYPGATLLKHYEGVLALLDVFAQTGDTVSTQHLWRLKQIRFGIVDLSQMYFDALSRRYSVEAESDDEDAVLFYAPEKNFNTRRAIRSAFEGQNGISVLLAMIKSVQIAGHCMNLACQMQPATGMHFSRCAGCKIFSYCSPECQRAAWTDSTTSVPMRKNEVYQALLDPSDDEESSASSTATSGWTSSTPFDARVSQMAAIPHRDVCKRLAAFGFFLGKGDRVDEAFDVVSVDTAGLAAVLFQALSAWKSTE